MFEIVIVDQGHPLYEQLIGPLREDHELPSAMWADAETLGFPEGPATAYCVAYDVQTQAAMAWRGMTLQWRDGLPFALYHNSYHRREYRDGFPDLYQAVFEYMEKRTRHLPAETYVFDQPRPVHEACGWWVHQTKVSMWPGLEPHTWHHMIREAQIF